MKNLTTITAIIVAIMLFVSCEGPTGPEGPMGPQGNPGQFYQQIGYLAPYLDNDSTWYEIPCAWISDTLIIQCFVGETGIMWTSPDWLLVSKFNQIYISYDGISSICPQYMITGCIPGSECGGF